MILMAAVFSLTLFLYRRRNSKLFVTALRAKAECELSREAAQYGVKQMIWDAHSTMEQTVDEIAEHFNLTRPE